MATYTSLDIYRAHRARPIHDGLIHSAKGTIVIPSGTLIADNSVIRLFRVDPSKIIPMRVIWDQSGPLDGHATPGTRALVGTLGYLKSANRAGTNLSFTRPTTSAPYATTDVTTTAATEDAAFLLVAASIPNPDPGTVDEFGTAGDGSVLNNGGVCIFPVAPAAMDARGYNANVMDVAVTFTEASTTATTADVIINCTLEFAGVANAGTSGNVRPYFYGQ